MSTSTIQVAEVGFVSIAISKRSYKLEPQDRLKQFKQNPFYNPVPDGAKKESSVPVGSPVWGEVYVDETGVVTNFRFHVEKGVGFDKARATLRRFIITMQQRLDRADECPFYEEEINELARTDPSK